ncbi:hypothetical protein Tco_0860350 [Tanacetum coccineum]|uniref:Uncharacterized protein n=1 Tax=Tanacetum coccineum TaxID=301880 RepID=A0ABQ5BIH8_9ASTR
MTSHELSLSIYTRLTCLPDILAFIIIGSEELLSLTTWGNVISSYSEIGSSHDFFFVVESLLLIMRMGASPGAASLSPLFHSPCWVSEAFAFLFLFPSQDGKAAAISLIPLFGVLIGDNRWCRAHDLLGNGNTWSCQVPFGFRACEGAARKFLPPFLLPEFLLDFGTSWRVARG